MFIVYCLLTDAQLQLWISNMRTTYGRLTKLPKSGSGASVRTLTERESWIKQTFGFLAEHIVRVKSRALGEFI